jgi:hypothetical protein
MWLCYMIEINGNSSENGWIFRKDGEFIAWQKLAPGAMWFDDGDLCVKIPGGTYGNEWNIDRGRKFNESHTDRKLPQWIRVGEPPNITVTPSINYVGFYHGWLRDGVLSDDCEGRIF